MEKINYFFFNPTHIEKGIFCQVIRFKNAAICKAHFEAAGRPFESKWVLEKSRLSW